MTTGRNRAIDRLRRERTLAVVPLAEQDRSRHHRAKVEAGRSALDLALEMRATGGPYVVQAAIASLQADENIDWAGVEKLYENLERITGLPVVTLNRAVAIAEMGEPQRTLELVDSLDLARYRYLHSTRAEFLRRLGRADEARDAYTRARQLAATEPERRFLSRKLSSDVTRSMWVHMLFCVVDSVVDELSCSAVSAMARSRR